MGAQRLPLLRLGIGGAKLLVPRLPVEDHIPPQALAGQFLKGRVTGILLPGYPPQNPPFGEEGAFRDGFIPVLEPGLPTSPRQARGLFRQVLEQGGTGDGQRRNQAKSQNSPPDGAQQLSRLPAPHQSGSSDQKADGQE